MRALPRRSSRWPARTAAAASSGTAKTWSAPRATASSRSTATLTCGRPNQPQPPVDWFATPYGVVYDTAIKERWLARLAGRLGWGADIGRMFEMMDEGVKSEPGQVVLDVPVGGAPPLRSAAGRLRGTYVGIDLSPAMLRRAARERAAEGLKNVILARADAMRLPIRSAAVDRVLCFQRAPRPARQGRGNARVQTRAQAWRSIVGQRRHCQYHRGGHAGAAVVQSWAGSSSTPPTPTSSRNWPAPVASAPGNRRSRARCCSFAGRAASCVAEPVLAGA